MTKKIFIKITVVAIWITFASLQLYVVSFFWGRDLFDRYIYQKNPMFGYGRIEGDLCRSQLNSNGYRDREFSPKKDGEYLILIVGDSLVYGQGLLQFQRYSNILEKELNKYRPTRVLNLGECGTNLYQHYLTAVKFREKLNPDLTIVGVTDNDLIVWKSLENYPPTLPITKNLVLSADVGEENQYTSRVLGSYDERSDNMVMFKYLLQQLPKDNTLYFFHISTPQNFFRERFLALQNELINHGYKTVNPSQLYEGKYRNIQMKIGGKSEMFISKKEQHPNYLANKMFAERLRDEILSDAAYGFTQ